MQYSDEASVAALAPILANNDLQPAAVTPRGQRPSGEARNIFDGHGRYISILGGNGLFHHPADQFPHAVDLELTTQWSNVLTELAVALAQS